VRQQCSHHVLSILVLRELTVGAFQFERDDISLFNVAVLQRSLNHSSSVMLEDEVLHSSCDDLEEFRDQLLPLL